MLSLTELFVILGVSLSCATLVIIWMERTRATKPAVALPPDPMSFLFDDGILHHATQNALTSFALLPGAHVWDDLRESLLARFPQFPETAENQFVGSMTMLPRCKDDLGLLTLHWRDSLCWVELTNGSAGDGARPDKPKDHDLLKLSSDTSPHPTWETLENGDLGWRNPAYDALVKRSGKDPDQALLQVSSDDDTGRVPLKIRSKPTEWFQLTSHKTADGMIHHATSVTHLLQAEDAQRTFVQTLAKTFAQLPIGLAIFDRKGLLSIFNPALVDLSGLEPKVLAAQPTMLSFFDALRENRRMPEPKNYNNWRKEITTIIAAAADGQYNETWTLEDGRTYTVQGRPHPDGATAFLIEDISAEVTLTRNFRTEVEQYEALLNTISDALVVFSSGGVVTFCNEAYRRMWGQNPEAAFADVTIQDAIKLWQTKADADWFNICEFIKTLGNRKTMDVMLSMSQNRRMSAQLTPIGSDATLIRFSAPAPKSVTTEAVSR